MGNLGIPELILIGIVGLLVLGPKRLPEMAKGLGEAFRSFQQAMNSAQSSVMDLDVDEKPSVKPSDRAVPRENTKESDEA